MGAVRPSTRSPPSCPVRRKRVGVGLEFSLAEEGRGGVSSAGTGARPWAGPGTGPEDRMRLWCPDYMERISVSNLSSSCLPGAWSHSELSGTSWGVGGVGVGGTRLVA